MPDRKKKVRMVGFGKNRHTVGPERTDEERAMMRIKAQREREEQKARVAAANAARRAEAYRNSPEYAAQERANKIAEIEAAYAEVVDPAKASERDAAYKAAHEATATRLNAEIQRAIESGKTGVAMDLALELARDQYGMEVHQIYNERFGNMPYHDNEAIREGRGWNAIGFAQPDFDWQGAVDDKYYWSYSGDPSTWRENEDSTLKSGLNARLNEERMKYGSAGQSVRQQASRDARDKRIRELAQANYDAVYGRVNQ